MPKKKPARPAPKKQGAVGPVLPELDLAKQKAWDATFLAKA